MKIELIEKEGLLKELTIEVPADTVNNKTEQKLHEIRKTVEFKGFRKGKAPMDQVRAAYGAQAKMDIAEDIIKETYSKAVAEKELRVASYPTISDFNYTDEGGLKYTAQVEVFPEIEKVVFDDFKAPESDTEIKDSEVDDIIELLRKRNAEVREVTRPVNDTDLVTLDIDKTADPGNILPNDKFENSEVDLSNKLTLKEFKDALPGMNVGDTKEIEVNYDADYPDKQFAGAKLTYKVTIKVVKERILPEVNDAFAKTTGEGETVLELRMKVREHLKNQKEEEQKRATKSAVINHIVEKNNIPVPQTLVDEYLKNVVEDMKKNNTTEKIDEDEIRKNYEGLGANMIRWNMLMHELAKQEKIEVQPSDVEALVDKFAANYNISKDQAQQMLRQSGNIADMRDSILEDKIVDFVIGKAN